MPAPPTLSAWRKPPEDIDFREPDAWYKGEHCNRFPSRRPVTVEDILYGWKPVQPLITSDSKVLAFGSCFAEYFIKFLADRKYNRWQLPPEHHSHSDENLLLAIPDTFENIFVIVQQFRWAFEAFTPQGKLWFTKDKRHIEATEERREKVRRSFEEGDVFLLTLGLSEVWFDQIENEPLWRTIPTQFYEAGRHVCRPATVTETLDALRELDSLAERFMPGKKFVFTLSPIPLIATFRNQSAVTANQASKAVLRAAIDEFIECSKRSNAHRYYYFPSYEIALQLFDRPFLPDNRHIRPDVASVILNIFSRYYTDLSGEELSIPEADARASALESQVSELQRQLEAKEQVIRELDSAARERLAVIQRLAAQEPDGAETAQPAVATGGR